MKVYYGQGSLRRCEDGWSPKAVAQIIVSDGLRTRSSLVGSGLNQDRQAAQFCSSTQVNSILDQTHPPKFKLTQLSTKFIHPSSPNSEALPQPGPSTLLRWPKTNHQSPQVLLISCKIDQLKTKYYSNAEICFSQFDDIKLQQRFKTLQLFKEIDVPISARVLNSRL